MKKPTLKTVLKYALAFLPCGTVSYLYLSLRDFGAAPELAQCRMLSDAFLIPGLIIILFALLITLSNGGALDGISYMAKRAISMLIPGMRNNTERFYDYIERKRKNPLRGYGFLFVVGGCFLIVSIYFYIRFYQLY